MNQQTRIRLATDSDIQILSDLVNTSYQTVADKFCLTIDNCPKHPSNCTEDWILSDFERGVIFFILESDGKDVGCAALEIADLKLCYLERLAVLPEKRNHGFGKRLVDHVFQHAKSLDCQRVSIGIIAKQHELKNWYLRIGFKEGKTMPFDHLPFDVMFMEYSLS